MIIYLIIFSVSATLIFVANKYYINNKKNKLLLEVLALLIPTVFAGIRNINIGTDVKVYIEPLFNAAINSDSIAEYFKYKWFDIWKYKYVSDFELGFTLITYFISISFRNIHVLLGIIQFIILYFVYKGIKNIDLLCGKEWLAMLIFYMLFFNISLNAMRQYIGIAIAFYGLTCLFYKKKIFITLVSLICAVFFHKSTIISFLLGLIYLIMNKKENSVINLKGFKVKFNFLFTIFVALFSFVIMLNIKNLLYLLDFLGMNKYSGYIEKDIVFSVNKVIALIPIIVIFFINGKEFIKSKNGYFYMLMFILGNVFFTQFASASLYGERIAYFFQIFNLISYAKMCNSKYNKNNNKIAKNILLLYLILYWWINYAYYNKNGTTPYYI